MKLVLSAVRRQSRNNREYPTFWGGFKIEKEPTSKRGKGEDRYFTAEWEHRT